MLLITGSARYSVAVLVLGLVAARLPAVAGPITITSVSLQIGGDSAVAGINASGQVLGTTLDGTGFSSVGHIFLYSDGVTTDLGLFGGRSASALSINNAGQIVGSTDGPGLGVFLDSNGQVTFLPSTFAGGAINDPGVIAGSDYLASLNAFHAALYYDGNITDLGTLGGKFVYSQARDINSRGEVAGYSSTADGLTADAFLYSHGVMTDIGGVGNLPWSVGTAINARGEVAGYSSPASDSVPGSQAFVYRKGQMTALGTLGADGSQALGINNKGEIVGSYFKPAPFGFTSAAFLWANGAMIDLNTLLPPGTPWFLASAVGINDAGQIVGIGYLNGNFGRGANHVYLLDLRGNEKR